MPLEVIKHPDLYKLMCAVLLSETLMNDQGNLGLYNWTKIEQ